MYKRELFRANGQEAARKCIKDFMKTGRGEIEVNPGVVSFIMRYMNDEVFFFTNVIKKAPMRRYDWDFIDGVYDVFSPLTKSRKIKTGLNMYSSFEI